MLPGSKCGRLTIVRNHAGNSLSVERDGEHLYLLSRQRIPCDAVDRSNTLSTLKDTSHGPVDLPFTRHAFERWAEMLETLGSSSEANKENWRIALDTLEVHSPTAMACLWCRSKSTMGACVLERFRCVVAHAVPDDVSSTQTRCLDQKRHHR